MVNFGIQSVCRRLASINRNNARPPDVLLCSSSSQQLQLWHGKIELQSCSQHDFATCRPCTFFCGQLHPTNTPILKAERGPRERGRNPFRAKPRDLPPATPSPQTEQHPRSRYPGTYLYKHHKQAARTKPARRLLAHGYMREPRVRVHACSRVPHPKPSCAVSGLSTPRHLRHTSVVLNMRRSKKLLEASKGRGSGIEGLFGGYGLALYLHNEQATIN